MVLPWPQSAASLLDRVSTRDPPPVRDPHGHSPVARGGAKLVRCAFSVWSRAVKEHHESVVHVELLVAVQQ